MSVQAEEEVITLRSGARVLACIADIVQQLQATGHIIRADSHGGAVTIEPPVHYEAWYILDSNWSDTHAVLASQSL